jgi:hypothetical protein
MGLDVSYICTLPDNCYTHHLAESNLAPNISLFCSQTILSSLTQLLFYAGSKFRHTHEQAVTELDHGVLVIR